MPPVRHTYWTCFLISSNLLLLSIGLHVSFADLGVSVWLSTFQKIFPRFLRTGISPDFAWIFGRFFPGVFSPWPKKKKDTWKSCSTKFSPYSHSIYSFKGKCNFCNPDNCFRKIKWLNWTDMFGRFSLGYFFCETVFWIWFLTFFSLMMISFFEILSKMFAKQTIYFKKISYRLLCGSFFILTLQGLERGVLWINGHCFKPAFLFEGKLYNFS